MNRTTAGRSARAEEAVPMPTNIRPMLCTLLKEPFDDPGYLFEVKWDGYRIIAYKGTNLLRLSSRGGHDYTSKYPSIGRALQNLSHDLVLDGEVVVLNKEGKPDFDALQNFNGKKSGVLFYVFDILWMDGQDLMDLPLTERKKILKDIVDGNSIVRYSDHFDNGVELFQQAQAMKLEGIIAKQRSSRYVPDRRGKEWYKIPTEVRQEFVVGGWIESETRPFRTLLFGAYIGSALHWIGHAGGGFKEREMNDILAKLKALEVKTSPFSDAVEYEGVVHWVEPKLVANIKYATLTRSGKIRKPAIFLGFREDKLATEVTLDESQPPSDISGGAANGSKMVKGAKVLPPLSPDSNWALVESEKIRNEETLSIEGCNTRVYNVDRTLWKGVTKAGLIQYYIAVAPYLLPHVKARPLSLHLKLKGPHAQGAYIKDMEGRQPDCAEIFTTSRKHYKSGKRGIIDYLVCNNTATLVYTINLGCIDVNPWTSTTHSPTTPDYIVIDLDPSDEDFSKAVECARAAKDFFDRHRLKAFAKTSGKTGMHLYLPCSGFNFQQARRIAEAICAEVQRIVPDVATTELRVADRGSKVYLDPNQNDFADTVAAPYSVRPSRHATVSAPLSWREVVPSLQPAQFDVHTMLKRLERKGDLFLRALDRKIASANYTRLKQFLG